MPNIKTKNHLDGDEKIKNETKFLHNAIRKRGRDKPTLKNKSARACQQRTKTWRDAQRTKREDHGAWLNLGSTYNIYKPLSCQVPRLTTFNKHLLPTKLIPSEGLRPWHSNFEKYYRSFIVYVSTICTNLKICQGEYNKHLLAKINTLHET